ncbi:MAG: hypothetical protein KDK91_34425, partial [Gammaproteobacteria bacterium]|nr:hypothetical protein [Gammaproteobacteria bacterium]
FWSYADRYAVDDMIPMGPELVDAIVGLDGFCEAMTSVGWAEVVDGGVRVPDYQVHNGDTAKRRADGARRVQKHRSNKPDEPGDSDGGNAAVTQSRYKRVNQKEKEKEKEKRKGAAPQQVTTTPAPDTPQQGRGAAPGSLDSPGGDSPGADAVPRHPDALPASDVTARAAQIVALWPPSKRTRVKSCQHAVENVAYTDRARPWQEALDHVESQVRAFLATPYAQRDGGRFVPALDTWIGEGSWSLPAESWVVYDRDDPQQAKADAQRERIRRLTLERNAAKAAGGGA